MHKPKASLDSFSFALRHELKHSGGVSVTCLMPDATETEFFKRADMMGTTWTRRRSAVADVAATGFTAMMRGEGDTVAGLKNKLQAAAHAEPNEMPAEMTRDGRARHGHTLKPRRPRILTSEHKA